LHPPNIRDGQLDSRPFSLTAPLYRDGLHAFVPFRIIFSIPDRPSENSTILRTKPGQRRDGPAGEKPKTAMTSQSIAGEIFHAGLIGG
jgi:hypothetical protein